MTTHRFIVSCLHCEHLVAIVGGVVDAEQLNHLSTHLLACNLGAVRGSSPPIETTLRHVRIEPLELEGRPPPAAA